MKSVWVTRTEPGASDLASFLKDRGFAAFARPLIDIQPLSPWRAIINGTPASATLEDLQPPTLVCALSAHAVEVFASAGLAASVGEAEFVAIGETTASALRALGFDAQIPRRASSEGLLAMAQIQALGPGDTIWILAGSNGRDVLQRKLLSTQRCRVVKLELYRRVSADPGSAVNAADVGAVEAASVQGLEEFAQAWQRINGPMSVPLVVPSARVGDAARTRGFSQVSVAAGASGEAVLTQLRRLMLQNDEEGTPYSMTDEKQNADPDAATTTPESAVEVEPSAEKSQPAEEEPQASAETPGTIEHESPKAVKPKGRVLAGLAFLIALLGVGGVAYLYYMLVYLQPLQDVRTQNTELSARYGQLQQELQTQLDAAQAQTSSSLQALQTEQAERLAGNEEAVLKSLNEALHTAPPSQREWKLAEAEYLMRIANHRVLMEQDSVGAMNLLQAADQIMADLDDFALHQVRARLADEIIALRQVPRNDLQGIYLQLEAIKSQLDNLPLPTPTFLREEVDSGAERSAWQSLLEELKRFIRIRPLDSGEALQPLLAPEEVRYLELNLRLSLEQAQLATLKRQQEVYEQSLLNVRRWLVDHVDVQDLRTQALLANIDELLILELARPLPEISESLNELLTLRRSGT